MVPTMSQSGLNYLLDKSKKVNKHSGVINYKFSKELASEIFNLKVVGGNFFETCNPFHVHVDTGMSSDLVRPTQNLLVPMSDSSDHRTVIFNQTYYGEASHFMIGSVYNYWPDPVYNRRKNNLDGVYDLSFMNCEDYLNYLTHLPYETVRNLSIKKVYKWRMYDPIMFESKYLHCSSNFNGVKRGLSLLIAS